MKSDKPRHIYYLIITFCGACWVAVVCSMMGRVLVALLIVIIIIIPTIWVIYLYGRDDQKG